MESSTFLVCEINDNFPSGVTKNVDVSIWKENKNNNLTR